MTVENSPNRPDRGGGRCALGDQRAMNRRGPEFAQITFGAQVPSQSQDAGFDGRRGPVDVTGYRRTIIPVDTVEPLTVRASHPALHRVQTHAGATGSCPQRQTPTNPADQVSSPVRRVVFFGMREYVRMPRGTGRSSAESDPQVVTL